MWTKNNKQFYEIFSNNFLMNFFLWFLSSDHKAQGILSSDTINFNNLHYVHNLCYDFFTGVMESAKY